MTPAVLLFLAVGALWPRASMSAPPLRYITYPAFWEGGGASNCFFFNNEFSEDAPHLMTNCTLTAPRKEYASVEKGQPRMYSTEDLFSWFWTICDGISTDCEQKNIIWTSLDFFGPQNKTATVTSTIKSQDIDHLYLAPGGGASRPAWRGRRYKGRLHQHRICAAPCHDWGASGKGDRGEDSPSCLNNPQPICLEAEGTQADMGNLFVVSIGASFDYYAYYTNMIGEDRRKFCRFNIIANTPPQAECLDKEFEGESTSITTFLSSWADGSIHQLFIVASPSELCVNIGFDNKNWTCSTLSHDQYNRMMGVGSVFLGQGGIGWMQNGTADHPTGFWNTTLPGFPAPSFVAFDVPKGPVLEWVFSRLRYTLTLLIDTASGRELCNINWRSGKPFGKPMCVPEEKGMTYTQLVEFGGRPSCRAVKEATGEVYFCLLDSQDRQAPPFCLPFGHRAAHIGNISPWILPGPPSY